MACETYVVRVTYLTGAVELHEFKNKKKSLTARDKFRQMDTVQSAKMFDKAKLV